MASPFLLALHGELTVVGKKPDGDSMRFIPRSPDKLQLIQRADRLRPSSVDGSHQLRFEGIDTPETHYGVLAQPLGVEARDRLLKLADSTTSSSTPVAASRARFRRRAQP